MSSATVAAVIAACAGLLGGMLAAFATRSTERLRAQNLIREKAAERRLSAIEAFILASHAWIDWLLYAEELGWADVEGKTDELSRRVRARDDAFRRLLLLASPSLHRWLIDVYMPAEYEVKRTYAFQVRRVGVVDADGTAARRAYTRLLRAELIGMGRADVADLRDPIGHGKLESRL